MPKGKPYKKAKPSYKKNYYSKKKPKSIMMKDANKVIKPEKKFWDAVNTLACPVGSAFVTTPGLLNGISAGTSASQKVGAKIRMKSLHIRSNAIFNGGQVASSPQCVRHVIVYDKQANGAVATRSDVFSDGTMWNSAFNRLNEDRFICLADEISDRFANGQFNVAWEAFRRLELECTGPSTSAVFNTGTVLYFVAANGAWNDLTAAHFPSVEFYCQIRYTDA